MGRTLTLWCPDWPVVALRRAGRAPAAGPVAVLDRGRVRAASAEARAEGVVRGLRKREAQARYPGVVVVEADPGVEVREFEPVARALDPITPRLAVERPGLLSFPLEGPSRYFGGEEEVAERVLSATAGVGVDARLGIADTPFAATLASKSPPGERDLPPGERGLFVRAIDALRGHVRVVPPGETAAFLAGRPVSTLAERGLGDLAGLLVRLGIRTLGDLAALPVTSVVLRFGEDGRMAHRLARGEDEPPAALTAPPPELAEVLELDPPVLQVDAAAFAAKSLAERFLARLERWGLTCTRVLVEAETEHGERRVRRWRHDGALPAAALAQRVRWQLDAWLTEEGSLSGALTLLRLAPDEVVPARGRQLGFWSGDPRAGERAGRALARLQGMLGLEAVVTPVLQGGRSPAERVVWVPWGEPVSERGRFFGVEPSQRGHVRRGHVHQWGGQEGRWPGAVPAPAPARVYDPPLPAELVDARGRTVEVSARGELREPPARLTCPGVVEGAVEAWAGPWLHDLRWWDPVSRRRRALFQVLVGSVACLATLERGRAGVEALYD